VSTKKRPLVPATDRYYAKISSVITAKAANDTSSKTSVPPPSRSPSRGGFL
jgi:hypothetical protein